MIITVYVLKNVNKYENEEEYFHADVYPSLKAAQKAMKSEFEETLENNYSEFTEDEMEVYSFEETCAELRKYDHHHKWEIVEQTLDIPDTNK